MRVEEIKGPRPATAVTVSFSFDPGQVFLPGEVAKAAKALGLTIPQSLLQRADQVIE